MKIAPGGSFRFLRSNTFKFKLGFRNQQEKLEKLHTQNVKLNMVDCIALRAMVDCHWMYSVSGVNKNVNAF